MIRTDLAVIGGGVAGTTATLEAAKAGFKVVLVERKKEPGKPVVCGEFLPSLDAVEFAADVLPELRRAYDIMRDFMVHETSRIVVEVKGYRTLEFDLKGFVIDKEALTRSLIEEAEGLGARVLLGERARRVERCDEGFVVHTSREKLSASVVIGADGFPSLTATCLSMKSGYSLADWAIAGHVRAEGAFDEDTVWMYIDPKTTTGGYAWVIPKSRRIANVGLGVRAIYARSKVDVRAALNGFLRLARIERTVEGPYYKVIPVGGLVEIPTVKGALLVGDSAGLVNPINGGGIPLAVASGIAAARYLSGDCYEDFLERASKLLRWGLTYRYLVDAFYEGFSVGKLGMILTPTGLALKVLKGEETVMLAVGRIVKTLLEWKGILRGRR